MIKFYNMNREKNVRKHIRRHRFHKIRTQKWTNAILRKLKLTSAD